MDISAIHESLQTTLEDIEQRQAALDALRVQAQAAQSQADKLTKDLLVLVGRKSALEETIEMLSDSANKTEAIPAVDVQLVETTSAVDAG